MKENQTTRETRRRYERVTAPALATINGCVYDVKDWSIDGFKVIGFSQAAKVGDCLPIQLQLNLYEGGKESISIKINTLVEIVWLSARQGQLGAQFLNLTKSEKDLLQNTIDKIVKGELTLINNDTKLLAPSVVPSFDTFQVNQVSNTPFKLLRSKRILYSLIYLGIGGVLGFYSLRAVYDSLVTMQIKSATVAKPLGPVVAPVEPVVAKEQGILSEFYIYEGMSVKVGQPLFSTQNDELAERDIDSLTQEIQLSRLELAESQADLKEVESLKQQEIEKLKSYQTISQTELDSARAKVAALTAQYQIEKDNLERFATLIKEGAVSQQAFDSTKYKFADAEAKLREAQAEYKVAQTSVSSAQKGNFYDGDKLISDLPRRTAEVDKLRQHVQIASQKVSSLKQNLTQRMQELQISQPQRQYLQQAPQDQNLFSNSSFSVVYKAPFPGSVLKVNKLLGSPIRPRETVMVLQREQELPTIDAYLTQEQADQVTIGSQATALIPSLNEEYQVRVTKIDRISRSPDQVVGTDQSRDSQNRPVYIQVTLDNVSQEDKSQLTAARGMPVILSIPKETNVFERLAFWLR